MKSAVLSLLLGAIIMLGCQAAAFAAAAEATQQADADTNAEQGGPPSLFSDDEPLDGQKASIRVRMKTSKNHDTIDSFTLYPYPVKPPVAVRPGVLPVAGKPLRNAILTIGFQLRPNPDKPYPSGGLRWTYAYRAGLKQSGLSEPHLIMSEYQFADELMPYVGHECKLRNDFEKARWERYEKANNDWTDSHVAVENEAIRLGITPITLRRTQWSIAGGQLPPGAWWLQATRKVAGLTYYWLQPITAAASQRLQVELNDNNALLILGGW